MDFTPEPVTVTFMAGQTETFVQVPITDDSVVEDTELFTAVLSTTGANVNLGDDATIVILDDDGK